MTNHQDEGMKKLGGYGRLFLALGLSLIVMFPLTMAFVARWSHFFCTTQAMVAWPAPAPSLSRSS